MPQVCAYAQDADDALLLLTMLGLYDDGIITTPESMTNVYDVIANPRCLPIGKKKNHAV